MRVLGRNKQTFYYSLYEGKEPILDHNGYETGEYKIRYSPPIKTSGVISPSKGKSQVDLFGRDVEYDRVIMLDDITCLIDESSIIFINYELSKSVDELFISEYVEGSNFNKAIEIYNGLDIEIDLSRYFLKLYVNGREDPSTIIQLVGSIEPKGVYVVAHSNCDGAIRSVADLLVGTLSFNGDDVVALFKDDKCIDIFGVIGETSWEIKDKTMVRKPDRIGSPHSWTVDDWIEFDRDTFEYLGSHEYTTYLPEPILFDSDDNPLNDYVVKTIGKSLNSISIAISRVKKS